MEHLEGERAGAAVETKAGLISKRGATVKWLPAFSFCFNIAAAKPAAGPPSHPQARAPALQKQARCMPDSDPNIAGVHSKAVFHTSNAKVLRM